MTKKNKKKRKNKKQKGSTKGGKFERVICKQLSQWWSGGKRDDIFWRTSGSGARASSRSKRGADTFGQYGDVQATDPIGQPLIDLCTIEIKKGYTQQTIFDLIDKLPTETKQPYRKFISQAITARKNSESLSWVLITKRDYKETLIIFNYKGLCQRLKENGASINRAFPCFTLKVETDYGKTFLFGTTLEQFFKYVKPKHIRHLVKRFKR